MADWPRRDGNVDGRLVLRPWLIPEQAWCCTGICIPSGIEAYVVLDSDAGPLAATAAPDMPAVSERIVSRHALCNGTSGPVATARGAIVHSDHIP